MLLQNRIGFVMFEFLSESTDLPCTFAVRTLNLVTFVPETSLKMFSEEFRYKSIGIEATFEKIKLGGGSGENMAKEEAEILDA